MVGGAVLPVMGAEIQSEQTMLVHIAGYKAAGE